MSPLEKKILKKHAFHYAVNSSEHYRKLYVDTKGAKAKRIVRQDIVRYALADERIKLFLARATKLSQKMKNSIHFK